MKPWLTKKLGEIQEKIKLEKAPVGIVPYIEIGSIDINSKNIIFSDKRAVKGSIFCPKNSILISRVRPTRGAVVLIDKKYAVSSAFTILKPKINPRLLFYFLAWNKKFFEYLGGLQKGTNYPSVRESDILGFEVSYPEDQEEQQKIVYVLDTIQAAVRAQEKIIELTKELKKSLMAKLFREGAPSFSKGRKLKKTEIGEIPEDWEVVRLGEIFSIFAGGDISKISYSPIKTNEFIYPIYSNTLEKDGLYGFSNAYQYPENCITITARGTLGHAIPRFEKFNAIIRLLVLVSKRKLNIVFIAKYINEKIRIMVEGSSIPQLTVPKISNCKIPLPPLSEQREIAEILEAIDQKIEIEQKKKALYEELFETMLNQIMSGKIDVEKLEV